MIWLITVAIVALVLGGKAWRDEGFGLGLLAFTLTTLVGIFVSAFVNLGFMYTGGEEWQVRETRTLQNVREDSETSGAFFLIAGGFDEDATFKYYSERNGVYTLNTVDAYDARIIMDGSEPRVATEVKHYSPNRWLSVIHKDSNYPRYTFYIPKGSIKQNYTLGE